MDVGIGEINPQGLIWTADTWLTYTPFVLALLGNFLIKEALYWRHGNNPLPEHMKYKTQIWNEPTN